MAYNFDRIFHEFILNKIKEIGVQNEEETYATTIIFIFLFM